MDFLTESSVKWRRSSVCHQYQFSINLIATGIKNNSTYVFFDLFANTSMGKKKSYRDTIVLTVLKSHTTPTKQKISRRISKKRKPKEYILEFFKMRSELSVLYQL